ncbi:hypothetical protein OG215_36795 (plasmid) [Streptomyces globisporus]|uniref:hypothetical protein n=1 Tax=Streptomyces globisporus TaxID=1908 RepID=UPI002F90DC35|nr:hypothetical protein OG215_36795 [Streptomyces globisporus]
MHTRMPDTAPYRGRRGDASPTAAGTAIPPSRQRTTSQMPFEGCVNGASMNGMGPLVLREAGTLVSVTGVVGAIRVPGPAGASALSVTLVGPDGGSTVCTLDAEPYLDLCTYLFDGTVVLVTGKVRRPAPGSAPLIDALAVHPVAQAELAVSPVHGRALGSSLLGVRAMEEHPQSPLGQAPAVAAGER